MGSKCWSSWLASLALVAALGCGVVLSGCSDRREPGPAEPSGTEGETGPSSTDSPPAPDQETEVEAPLPLPLPDEGAAAEEPGLSTSPDLGTGAADPNARLATYAPVGDLVGQVAEYISDLEGSVASEEDYKDFSEKIAKDANTLALIALALGLHEDDNAYKASSGALVRAAQEMAATKDFASAKSALAKIKQATADASAVPAPTEWGRVASLPETMKKVPLINTSLKGYLRRMERRAKDAQGECAVLAVIGQGSMANVGDTQQPAMVEAWCAYCLRMRDTAAALSATIPTLDQEGVNAKLTDLQKSCDECHAVFCPEQLEASKAL